MSVNERQNVAKMQTSYVKQREAADISAGRKRKLLFRRLAVFIICAAAISVFMISTLVSQSATLDEKIAEKKEIEKNLTVLEKQKVMLEEEIVKLNDDEYIAKLLRRDYFLSENNEIIFTLPDEKKKKVEKSSTD